MPAVVLAGQTAIVAQRRAKPHFALIYRAFMNPVFEWHCYIKWLNSESDLEDSSLSTSNGALFDWPDAMLIAGSFAEDVKTLA